MRFNAALSSGIFHGNKGSRKREGKSRNPLELLEECLPSWYRVLKTGGAAVIAWNTYVASKQKLIDIFMANGFEVRFESPYDEFEHMVDKAIKRNIILARKY